MIGIFKSWIIALLCLAILVVIVQLIIPKTNLRKYIYTLIGIITVITIISPVVDMLKKGNIQSSISEVLSKFSNNSDTISVNSDGLESQKNQLIKIQFIQNLKSDVMLKLAEKNIVVNDINIVIDDDYNITKMEIKIAKIDNKNASINSVSQMISYINTQYDIDYSKITVVEEGE